MPRLPGESFSEMVVGVFREPARLTLAWPFALALLAVLVAHEAGHYLVARHFGIDQSLPFFLPAPMLPFGTLGAVIVTRGAIASRPVLLRMAAAGPWAGMAVALPLAVWGLAHSQPLEAATHGGRARMFGRSLLFGLLEDWVGPAGSDVLLHPVALAAWAGFFITSLNLIPAAQLDGGHIAYALFGDRHRRIGRGVTVALAGLGLWTCADHPSGGAWLVWAGLLALVGLRHPPVRWPEVPLTAGDRRLGLASLALFAATFVPLPTREVIIEVRRLPFSDAMPAPLLPDLDHGGDGGGGDGGDGGEEYDL